MVVVPFRILLTGTSQLWAQRVDVEGIKPHPHSGVSVRLVKQNVNLGLANQMAAERKSSAFSIDTCSYIFPGINNIADTPARSRRQSARNARCPIVVRSLLLSFIVT